MKNIVGKICVVGAVAVFALSCSTKDGDILQFKPQFGNLVVTSTNAFGARIFLDYKDTGRTTPTLFTDISAGVHVVHVFLNKNQPSPDSAITIVEEGKETTVNFTLNKVASGDLSVRSSPDSARVWINKLEFGYSPLTVIGLPSGTYNVFVYKGSYGFLSRRVSVGDNQVVDINETLPAKRVVLLEHFSNTNCPPCPEADAIIEEVFNEFGAVDAASVSYHPFYPSNSDPMYLAAKEAIDLRVAYYQAPPLPFVSVNGKQVNFSSFQQLRDNLRNELQTSRLVPPEGVEIQILDYRETATLLEGKVRVKALMDLGEGYRLRIALIERQIVYDKPPGTNGQSRFTDVLRDFYPDANGIALNLRSGQKTVRTFVFDKPSVLGTADAQVDLDVVAFVQNDNTREVGQAIWTAFP